jgi:iron-sulfur cluster repair protein YtfE (RIC family)
MTAREGDPTGGVSTTATLGKLVVQDPGRTELFERLRLDYCCGGAKTLSEACRERGFDPDSDNLPACCKGWLAEQTHRHYHRARRRKELS